MNFPTNKPLSLRRPQSQFVGRERSGQAGDAGSENDDVPTFEWTKQVVFSQHPRAKYADLCN